MELNSEIIKFQFDDNYKEIIENSSIVRDFDTFIEMANDGLLELSNKSGVLSIGSAALVNETILRNISVQLRRPLIKSFPNALSLFILFSLSGLRENKIKGKKKYLSVNARMLEQWKQFSDVDKYFNLFSLIFTNFTFEPINEKDGYFEFNIVMNMMAGPQEKLKTDKKNDYFFNGYKYKSILITLDMLGLIDIEEAPQLENETWSILSIQPKSFMHKRWSLLNSLRLYGLESESEDDEEYREDQRFVAGDIEEIARRERFADKIAEQIPEFTQRLKIDFENRPGIYYFKANLGTVWRTYKVDFRSSLDDLCVGILESFDFDLDHLYDVAFFSSFGFKLMFNGSFHIGDAEYPTTDDILIGDLPIRINDKMKFTYDYGDNWQFQIVIEKIEAIKKETKKIPDIELVDFHGEAPEQYPDWD